MAKLSQRASISFPEIMDSIASNPWAAQLETSAINSSSQQVTEGIIFRPVSVSATLPIPISLPPSPMAMVGQLARVRK